MSGHWPVIIGVGEVIDRPDDPAQSLEPLALMAEALRRADDDAGGHALYRLDSLDIVHQVSWRYERTAASLCERLGIQPARAVYGVTGGESPMRYLHEAALRIARGESSFAAIVGAEAQYAVNKATSAKIGLPWTPAAKDVENPFSMEGRINATMLAHGAIRPIHVYPFYENAAHVAWGQTPREAQVESAELYSRISGVAASNPFSWSKRTYTAEEIATATPDNRLICYPYSKRMVANPAVNQGAAILLTSLARASELGLESRAVFIWGGSSAMEPRDYLARDQYIRSDAQDRVLSSLRQLAHASDSDLDTLELYSCFPCVPKMTRRVLGLGPETTPTVTGGLSFFGAPLNNYMTHAACAMVRRIRIGQATTGLLYGQGEFITKHHGVVVSSRPPRRELASQYSVQAEVGKRGRVPALSTEYEGRAVIETFTLIYDRGQSPVGVVIARTGADTRVMARVSAGADDLKALVDQGSSPIGRAVHIYRLDETRLGCRFA